jgi:hypothetical protein
MTEGEAVERAADPAGLLRPALKSQYHAALAMLRQAVELCPDDLWTSRAYASPFWRIAYHALFYTHFYIQPRMEAFRPWERHCTAVEDLDDMPAPPGFEDLLAVIAGAPWTGEPYTKAEILEYWAACDAMVDAAVDALDLASAECGFRWYRMTKLEHQFVSIRHLQHHVAQLASRVRDVADVGVDWVGARRPAPPAA